MTPTIKVILAALVFANATLISGCQTVKDQSIPLSKDFVSHSILVELKRPTWQFKDSHFQQKTPNFEMNGLDIGSTKTVSSQQWLKITGFRSSGLDISDKFLRFVFQELIDFREKTTRQIAFKAERDYAFQTRSTNSGLPPVDTRCRLLYLDDVRQIERPRENEKFASTNIEKNSTRKYSFLRCELRQNEQTWQLSLDATADESPHIQLKSMEQSPNKAHFRFEDINNSQYLVNGEWRELPLSIKTISGLKVLDHNQQIAALSYDGNSPKIWLHQNQDKDQSLVLLAASYALLMHDWLDQDWRSPFNQGSSHR